MVSAAKIQEMFEQRAFVSYSEMSPEEASRAKGTSMLARLALVESLTGVDVDALPFSQRVAREGVSAYATGLMKGLSEAEATREGITAEARYAIENGDFVNHADRLDYVAGRMNDDPGFNAAVTRLQDQHLRESTRAIGS
jgi:hypothetical protein